MAEFTHAGDPPFWSMPYRTVPTGNGAETVEVDPDACPNGHPMRRNLRRGYGVGPDRQRRHWWQCGTCGVEIWGS